MAAINVSPESFHGDSIARGEEALREAIVRAEREGAQLIDIGALSTAPNRETVISEEEERARMRSAVRTARASTALPISADTQRYSVAEAALEEGANWINDVSCLRTAPQLPELCARYGAGLILMASETPGAPPLAAEPVAATRAILEAAAQRALAAGLLREQVILDPGIGFFRGQSIPWFEWDLALLRGIERLRIDGYELLVGASRKSFLGKVLGRPAPEDRLAGSLAVALWCAARGVDWLRVHDVAATGDALRMMSRLC
jgi:dihydropteroate synthase